MRGSSRRCSVSSGSSPKGERNVGCAGGRLFALVVLVLVAGVIAALGAALPSPVDAEGHSVASTVSTASPATVLAPAENPSASIPTTVRIPILMYHYVNTTPPPAGPYADSLTVRTHEFEEQMAYLVDNGYTVIGFAQLEAGLQGTSMPEKPVILTFDDGGADNYSVAYPILRKHGFAATFFLITGKVGGEGYVTWDEVREMHTEGMAIGSHTVSHPDLSAVGAERLAKELEESRDEIERQVGVAPTAFCYPSGAYDDEVISALIEAGYRMAVTTKLGKEANRDTTFELPRVRMRPFMALEEFARLLQ